MDVDIDIDIEHRLWLQLHKKSTICRT